ncbi:MAG: catalase/peroxidase HPI [Microbacteriaceae bacterium]|jgi:catalase-peroxidase|nr:catalase/peroxidase HPI [Microbacteriaceae bacterium]HOA87530.1 catalase/peroxidase HPI [Microbacteriaceae bacterium]HPZ33767.1 catalase/peroxidase HPI [Microbacteriaceae bacterium]
MTENTEGIIDAPTSQEKALAENEAQAKCPVVHGGDPRTAQGTGNQEWWPNRLNLRILAKNQPVINPYGASFDYKAAFEAVDLDELRRDVEACLTTPQDWWPADFDNYGPAMVRMAWHSAGTYRVTDGRGGGNSGQQRFAPLNSWPDNAGLDKARRILWPVKKKYGKSVSWADLMIFAGTVAMDQMGFTSFGFAGGRVDAWEPDDDVYWGSETSWLGDEDRYTPGDRDLENPLAAVQMGLIYVNPEGIGGNPDPVALAGDIRETFKRMAMDDEETVALIAGGHTFGKTHGAASADHVGDAPESAGLEHQGLGWHNSYGTGKGDDQIASGLEVTWTYHPTRWDNEFFHILFAYEWELMDSPAGAKQWRPVNGGGADMVPMAHDATKRREPRMLTSDLSLRFDPIYGPISKRFNEDPEAFADAFARAWFKLTHRDMGPSSRYLGKLAPTEELLWQDPVPAVDHELIDAADQAALKQQILAAGLSVSELVSTAWASAASFRNSDKRGGANGARLALAPQKDWAANNPERSAKVLSVLTGLKDAFNAAQEGGKRVSLADLIVLAGNAGVEQAAKDGGHEVTVPFRAGRTDATQEKTDVESFGYLEPTADGFRNYVGPRAAASGVPAEHLLIDKANLLNLTAPEMTALIGGLRVLDTNWDGSSHGVFTERPGVLSRDFFVNLLDMGTQWAPIDADSTTFQATDVVTGEASWVGTRVDLVFGSNSELRAIAEVYGADDADRTFIDDFVAAWAKVADADRFELI